MSILYKPSEVANVAHVDATAMHLVHCVGLIGDLDLEKVGIGGLLFFQHNMRLNETRARSVGNQRHRG